MRKKLMIFAAACLLLGMIMAGIGWSMGGKGILFTFKNGINYKNNQVEYAYTNMDMEKFDGIEIDISNCPIQIMKSEDGKYGVDVKLSVEDEDDVRLQVEDGILQISTPKDSFLNLSWDFSFWDDTDQYVYVYLPEKEYNKIYASTSNSNIIIEGVDTGTGTVTADTSNGRIELIDVYAQRIIADTSNSSVSIENVYADEISVDTSNGRVELAKTEAEAIRVDTSNGGISFDTVYGQSAVLDTSNGSIDLVNVSFDTKLEVKTTNSSIEVEIDGAQEDYSINADTSNSSVYIGDNTYEDDYRGGNGDSKLKLDTSNGKIVVEFR